MKNGDVRSMETGSDVERGSRQGRGAAAGAAVTGAGVAALAGAAVACCSALVAPFVVAALGVSGAVWVAGLAPWAPYLLGSGLLLLIYATVVVRRSRACVRPARQRWRRWVDRSVPVLLAVSSLIWAASAGAYLFAFLTP